jgi:hypothetical protein
MEKLRYRPRTSLRQGLEATVSRYREQLAATGDGVILPVGAG